MYQQMDSYGYTHNCFLSPKYLQSIMLKVNWYIIHLLVYPRCFLATTGQLPKICKQTLSVYQAALSKISIPSCLFTVGQAKKNAYNANSARGTKQCNLSGRIQFACCQIFLNAHALDWRTNLLTGKLLYWS